MIKRKIKELDESLLSIVSKDRLERLRQKWIGKQVNKLTVLSIRLIIDETRKSNATIAIAKCECGETASFFLTRISNGLTKSCGCHRAIIKQQQREALIAATTEKECYTCKEVKNIVEFYESESNKDGLSGQCKICKVANDKPYSENKRQYNEKYRLKTKFGITVEEREYLLQHQQHRCAICNESEVEKQRKLAIDHNHLSNKIRGMLCMTCNAAMGLLKADIGVELLQKAILYIKETEDESCDPEISRIRNAKSQV